MTDPVRDAIRGRRSVGRVTDDPVPPRAIREIIEAATWAPNHRMTNPWRFVVLAGEALDRLGEAHARAVARQNPAIPPEGLAAQAALTRRAPVIVACISSPGGDDPVVRREDRDAVAAAIQNMLLAAHVLGLGAIWRTGPFVDEPEVRDHLGCAARDEIVGFVYVGRPAADTAAPERRPLEEVVEWRGTAPG